MPAQGKRRQFLSTPSARRATSGAEQKAEQKGISIHALREEGDSTPARRRSWLIYFYPRPPRGGRRFREPDLIYRRAISIHALREEGDVHGLEKALSQKISIHALREEGDVEPLGDEKPLKGFLSTPSARRATRGHVQFHRPDVISIHALREEGDTWLLFYLPEIGDFYPRPPRGGRLLRHTKPFVLTQNFYPRPPRGGRPDRRTTGKQPQDFYPRPPRGGRRRVDQSREDKTRISIHALREEGDPADLHG